ncbi:LysR family transcriptional regulator [Adlercreutzia sp. R25]|uniref:LysR family transcriptional regulator n=1 Tax=Adlercreutzia shanghongiae TaxID=3111773 RepID=UPI002DB6CF77|nr:LysR family transcriptional regulator [Adlercreutzia sp. R25]MEC4271917.1 LysR family transcriptional regulator [Adlercreutzia sp. R25]
MLSRRVETFVSVADLGSLSKAAAALYLAPVSVKRQIDGLESELGVKLFTRTKQGVRLTEPGRIFYDAAQRLIAEAAQARTLTREAARAESYTVRIGTSLLRPCTIVTDLWASQAHDAVIDAQILPFDDGNTGIDDLSASLGRDIDCFVAPCDSAKWHEECSVLLLSTIPLTISLPKTHPLAQKEELTWEDIEGETLMIPRAEGYAVLAALRQDIADNHPSVSIVDSSAHTAMDTFNQCSRDNCLMLSFPIWKDVHPMLTTRPVQWPYRIPYGMVYAANPSPAMELFADALKRALAS